MAAAGAGKHICIVAMLAASLALGACQKKDAVSLSADGTTADPMQTGTTGPSFKRTDELSKKWGADQANVDVGLAYADSLGQLGQKEAQMQVLRTLSAKNAEKTDVQAKLGKQFLVAGETGDAVEALERAVAVPGADAMTFSALGSAYDQQSRYDLARKNYTIALQMKPGDAAITNNLAMSHALEGKLPEAERLLRDALKQPGAKDVPRVRQNLALVVGLQGRFDEARKIASEDLPPDQVEANLAYLQQMLSQPNTWQQITDQGDQGETNG